MLEKTKNFMAKKGLVGSFGDQEIENAILWMSGCGLKLTPAKILAAMYATN